MNAEQEQIYSVRASTIVNILKGLAIWMIVTVHFFQSITMNSYIELLANCMQLGFQIFFTLSCFSLCLSYSKNKLTYWQYFKKHILKILLTYYIMLIVMVIYNMVVAMQNGASIIQALNLKALAINALLLNTLIPTTTIVYGGWFISTLVILYLLFPLLYKIYDIKNQKWKKCKNIILPLTIIAISTIILGGIYVVFGFNGYYSFIYNNFINQICAFIFGFVIFYLYQTVKIKKIKFPLIKAMLCALIAIVLFIKIQLSHYVIVMVLVALATMYMFTFLFNNAFTKDNLDSELIMRFLAKTGKNSVGIFYCHFFLVWELTREITSLIFKLDSNPHVLIKIGIGILIYTLCYWIGKLFTFIINSVQTPLLNRINN